MLKLTTSETGRLKLRLYAYAKAHKLTLPRGYRRLVPAWGGASRKLALLVSTRMGYKVPVSNPDARMLYAFGIRKRPVTVGHRALKWMGEHRVVEQGGNNRGTALDALWRAYAGSNAYIGQPWCGLMVWASFKYGAGVDLHSATIVYTPSVTANARANRAQLHVIKPSQVQEGDIVLFDWAGSDGSSPLDDPASQTDHIGIARGPVDFATGTVPTREGNTQPGNSGDQSGRGGLDGTYDRDRALTYVICFARVVPAK